MTDAADIVIKVDLEHFQEQMRAVTLGFQHATVRSRARHYRSRQRVMWPRHRKAATR